MQANTLTSKHCFEPTKEASDRDLQFGAKDANAATVVKPVLRLPYINFILSFISEEAQVGLLFGCNAAHYVAD